MKRKFWAKSLWMFGAAVAFSWSAVVYWQAWHSGTSESLFDPRETLFALLVLSASYLFGAEERSRAG